MSELRWHPFLKQWVAVTTHRQDRPQMPKDWCPFCPGSGKVPDHYSVHLYTNDFAAFSPGDDEFVDEPALYATTGARGACDVVLYSSDHTTTPAQLTVQQWREVIGIWTSRTEELYAKPGIAYVAVFENQGEAIGVTMPHPHGQIYALPFIPPTVQQEIESAREHHQHHHGECLHCRVVDEELIQQRRLVDSNNSFAAFVPFYGRYPTEIHLYSRRHLTRLNEMTDLESDELAAILSRIRKRYDALYGFPLPLMMALRQYPASSYSHFHIQFLPIQRSANKLKYMAAIESAHGAFLNDTRAEDQASILRSIVL